MIHTAPIPMPAAVHASFSKGENPLNPNDQGKRWGSELTLHVFGCTCPCAVSQAKLADQPPGTFIVRSSDSADATLCVIKSGGGSWQQRIEETPKGLQLKGSEASHQTLEDLVAFYRGGQQPGVPIQLVSGPRESSTDSSVYG